jgi:surfactin synthase thioesterase subunit
VRENVADKLKAGFKEYKNNFKKVKELTLFDGSHIYIYKNKRLIK